MLTKLRWRKQLTFGLKLAVSAGTLWILLRYVSVDDTIKLIGQARWPMVLLAVVVFGFGQLASSLRCRYIVHTLGGQLSFMLSARVHFIGLWFNQVLPTSLGGDIVKITILRWHLGLSLALRATLLDRASGLVFILFSIVVLMPGYLSLFPDAKMALALCAGAALALCVLAMMARFARGVADRLSMIPVVPQVMQLFDDVYQFRSGRALFEQFATSLTVHIAGILTYALVGGAIGADVSWLAYFLLVPLVFLVALMPVSLAGWGIREAGAVWLFGFAGVPAEVALAMSILFGLALIGAGIPGLLLLLTPDPVPPAVEPGTAGRGLRHK